MSGLAVSQSAGATIVVSAGVLFQNVAASLPDVPAAGALDSPYRFGISLSQEDVGDPWDGTAAWWLLESRVVRVTTLNEARDIFNPALGTFAAGPAIDKQYEAQIEFQWTKDPVGFATALPTPTVGWAPTGWCVRPMVYAAITDDMVGGMGLQVEDIVGHDVEDGKAVRRNMRFRQANVADSDGVSASVARTYKFDLEAEINGIKVYARTIDGGVCQLDSTFIEAVSVAALNVGGTWGYVYLASGGDWGNPSNFYGPLNPEVVHRGVLLISRVPPDAHGLNSGAITHPLPLPLTLDPGEAVHIGYIRSAGAGSHYFIDVSSKGVGRIALRELVNGAFPLTQANGYVGPAGPGVSNYNLAVLGPGATEDIPWGATSVKCVLEHTAVDAAAVAMAVEMTHSMTTAAGLGDSPTATNYPRMMLPTDVPVSKEFDLYTRASNLEMRVTFVPLTAALANTGGGAAHGGNNAFRTAMIGFTI